MFRPSLMACLWNLLLIGTVFGHAGHGVTPPESVTHYVVEPTHGWPLLAIIGLLAFAAHRVFRRRQG
ncbi:MAG: hypothetical protein R3B90_18325 [Planctomycetaceae bacterium]